LTPQALKSSTSATSAGKAPHGLRYHAITPLKLDGIRSIHPPSSDRQQDDKSPTHPESGGERESLAYHWHQDVLQVSMTSHSQHNTSMTSHSQHHHEHQDSQASHLDLHDSHLDSQQERLATDLQQRLATNQDVQHPPPLVPCHQHLQSRHQDLTEHIQGSDSESADSQSVDSESDRPPSPTPQPATPPPAPHILQVRQSSFIVLDKDRASDEEGEEEDEEDTELLEEATDSDVDDGASHGARESGGELLAPTATHATASATGGQGDSSAQTREMSTRTETREMSTRTETREMSTRTEMSAAQTREMTVMTAMTAAAREMNAAAREMSAAAPHAFSDTSGSESQSDTESTSGDELPLPPLHLHLAPTAK